MVGIDYLPGYEPVKEKPELIACVLESESSIPVPEATTIQHCLPCLLLAGCRKELCYNHDEHSQTVKLEAKTTWECEWERPYDHNWRNEWQPSFGCTYEDLCPQPAVGIRAIAYGDDGYYKEANPPTEGGRLPAREGKNSILLYNNDTEYIVFDGLEVSITAQATTNTISRSTLGTLHSGERNINQPAQLYGYYADDVIGEKTLLQRKWVFHGV